MDREIEIVEDAVARKGAMDVCRRVIALRKDRERRAPKRLARESDPSRKQAPG